MVDEDEDGERISKRSFEMKKVFILFKFNIQKELND